MSTRSSEYGRHSQQVNIPHLQKSLCTHAYTHRRANTWVRNTLSIIKHTFHNQARVLCIPIAHTYIPSTRFLSPSLHVVFMTKLSRILASLFITSLASRFGWRRGGWQRGTTLKPHLHPCRRDKNCHPGYLAEKPEQRQRVETPSRVRQRHANVYKNP